MLISHPKKFIFIHNPKVAGTSIRNVLIPYSNDSIKGATFKERVFYKLHIYPSIFSSQFPGHIKARDLQKKIPGKVFNNYFKFGFVRNPWDWHVSLYSYILKLETHHHHQIVKNMKSFDEYIEWRVEKGMSRQKDFFYDVNGNCLVDFIGKYENINEDFQTVCRKIKIVSQLPYLNKSRDDQNFLKFYSQKSLDMVNEAFKDDILSFGYTKPVLSHTTDT